jgi:predicted nuclease with TOPRIM domain
MSNAQPTMDSLRELNAKLLDEITELRKKFAEIECENVEIPELRRKVAEVEAENAKLKQIIEENARRDARVEELEQKNTELEARLAILEQNSLAVDGQPQNDNEVPPSCICSDTEIKVEAEKCFAKDLLPEVTLPPILNYRESRTSMTMPLFHHLA